MFTVLVGVLFLTLFPKSTTEPVSLMGFRYFTEHESQILSSRVARDDPSKLHAKSHVSWAEFKATVRKIPQVEYRLPNQQCPEADFMTVQELEADIPCPVDHRRPCAVFNNDSLCAYPRHILWLRQAEVERNGVHRQLDCRFHGCHLGVRCVRLSANLNWRLMANECVQ